MCAKRNTSATDAWAKRYQAALLKYLQQCPWANLRSARELGSHAVSLGVQTLDAARFHEQALKNLVSKGGSVATRKRIMERAKNFFSETIVPIEKTHPAAVKDEVRVDKLNRVLRQRTIESSASTRSLARGIARRQASESALKKSDKRHAMLLSRLHRLQKHLRDLTHTYLSTQENERRKMSTHLQDDLAQALIAIDIRLLALKKESGKSMATLKREIASTQRLVKQSAKRIDRFAHEFGIRHET